jgi:hypothetical protein
MNKFLKLKNQLMLLDPFIRLKRIKEILVHVKAKKYRKELIEIARITIYQLNKVREGEERFSLDAKLSKNIEDLSEKNIDRTIEEIAEEESTLIKKEEEQQIILYDAPEEKPAGDFYSGNSEDKPSDFYKSTEIDQLYNAPEEDKKEKRFYF